MDFGAAIQNTDNSHLANGISLLWNTMKVKGYLPQSLMAMAISVISSPGHDLTHSLLFFSHPGAKFALLKEKLSSNLQSMLSCQLKA